MNKNFTQEPGMLRRHVPKLIRMMNPVFHRINDTNKRKWIMRVNVTAFLILISIMQVSATAVAQRISLSEKNTPLSRIFIKISEQSGYDFLVTGSLLKTTKPVSINVKNADFNDVLTAIFKDQPISFKLEDKVVVVSKKEAPSFLDKLVDAFTPPVDVYGVVLDEKGLPLPGATVKVKGLQQSTTTDGEGKFSLKGVDEKAMLVISFIGYAPKEVAAKASISVSLEIQSAELQEVNVAYGKTTQQALTGSVTVVNGEQIQNLPNRSFDKSLQGLVPGLQITNGTGQPGGGVSNIVLRGIATSGNVNFIQGVRNPLFVIDGLPVSQDFSQFLNGINVTKIGNPLAQLNPSDIETLTVLKDASAIALYGSKASNGVIVVTTKKGKSGKTVFSFRHQTDMSEKLSGGLKVLNQEQYLQLLYQTYKNTNPAIWTDQTILTDLKSRFPTKADGSFYDLPDWSKEVFNVNAKTYSNEFSMSGGNEKNNYYLNLEYTTQDGVVKKTGYDRKSVRFNFENRPLPALKLGMNTTLSYNLQDYANAGEAANSYGAAETISPLIPIRLEDGNYKLTNPIGLASGAFTNPIAEIEYNLNKNIAYRGLTNVYADLSFLKHFKFRSNLGVDFSLTELKTKNDPRFYASLSSLPLPKIAERDYRTGNIINTNIFDYNGTFGENHSLNILLGQEAQILTTKVLQAEGVGTAATLPYYEQLSSPGYTMNYVNGNNTKQTLLSIFTQANYAFKNKYFVTGSIRRDGSSRFGNQQRWGSYWSTGLGWIISKEGWLNEKASWLNYLKIRGSIGAAGNSAAIDVLTRYDLITIRTLNNGNFVRPSSSPGNPDIKWEQTFSWDAGLELRILNERLAVTADYYQRKTSDLIYTENLSSISGYQNVLSNIGDMLNKGVELSASAKIIRSNGFNLDIGANWSSNINKLVRANILLTLDGNFANEEGRNFNSFYLPIWAGVNSMDGKPQWLDENGVPTSVFADAKKEFVGKPQPDGFGSITSTLGYKNFELTARAYYQYGVQMYNSALQTVFLNDGLSPYGNQSISALDYWKVPGDITTNPRRLLNNTDGGYRPSTRYLFNGDYIRLQNLVLAYNFSGELIKRLHLSKLRVYLQGQNLFTITKYSGSDPDNVTVGGNTTGFAYPIQKTYSLGINLNF